MRIVAGAAGGRRLAVPAGEGTRPTSERVREALFAALEARGAVRDARVLDLCAGSGALGLEAASRGAACVVLVDDSPAALAAARRNIDALGLSGVRAIRSSMQRYLAGPASEGPFDLVLLDPPYALGEHPLGDALARLVEGGWLAEGALVAVERSIRSPAPTWPAGLDAVGEARRYGDTAVWLALLRSATWPPACAPAASTPSPPDTST